MERMSKDNIFLSVLIIIVLLEKERKVINGKEMVDQDIF